MLPEYTPGANLYDYAFYGPMQTDDNAILSSFQVGGMPWAQQQQQQQGGDDQIMQYIQMYSEITESDPEEVMNQLSSMSQEDQQAALQEMVSTIQKYYTMQQSRQQNQMVDEQQQGMYDDEDESAEPVQYQKPYDTPTPEELAGLEAEEEQYNAAVEAATADYDDEEYMYGGSKRRRNKFTSQLKKAARGMAQEMVNTDSLPTGNSSYGGERLKKFVAGIQRNVANNMADEAVEQSMDYFEQPEMMRYGGLPRYQGTQGGSQVTGQGCPPGGCIPEPGSQTPQNITLTPEQFNQLLARQYSNQGYYPGNYGGYGGRGLGSLLHMFGAAPISNDWYMPRGYRMTNRSQKDLKDQLMLSGKIPLEASYLSNVEATKGFLGNIYNPRKVSMTFSRALPQINVPGSSTSTSVTPAENAPSSSWNQDIRVNTKPSDITIPPVTIGSGTQTSSSPATTVTTNPSVTNNASNVPKDIRDYSIDLFNDYYRQGKGAGSNWLNDINIASKLIGEEKIPGSIMLPGQIGPLNEGQSQMEDLVGRSRYPQTVNINGADPLYIDPAKRAAFNEVMAKAPQGTSYQTISPSESIFNQGNTGNTGLPYAQPNPSIPTERNGGQLYLYNNGGSTLYDYVKSKGLDPSFKSRKAMFQQYFDDEYTGSYEQNVDLQKRLASGEITLQGSNKSSTKSKPVAQQSKQQSSGSKSTTTRNNKIVLDPPIDNKEVSSAKKQNVKEVNRAEANIPPMLVRPSLRKESSKDILERIGINTEPFGKRTLQSGTIVDKATGTIHFVEDGKIKQQFPVLTGQAGRNYDTDPNENPYKVSYLRNNPAARSTPTGTYKMKYDKSIYGYPGYYQQPIAAFGKAAPDAENIAMHIVYGAGAKPGYKWDPSQGVGAKPYYNPEEYQRRLERFSQPDNRFGSYGCTNFEPYSLECLTKEFGTEGDTAIYIDSRNPSDKVFIDKFPKSAPLKKQQIGGQLYLYQDGGLPRFQGPDASEVTLAPRSMSNPGQSAKTFGDTEFAMEPFDNSALVAARPQPMQLPTKTLQERAQEIDPDASMKTFDPKFRKNPLSAAQYADIAYAGTNIVTNLKNRADQELAQAEMLNRETDPYNYFAETYANPDEGININTYDIPYQSFMGQRQQFSPGVSSGFAKFGGMMKMGGTYEMDLTPEEVAYIQRMGGTIEYL